MISTKGKSIPSQRAALSLAKEFSIPIKNKETKKFGWTGKYLYTGGLSGDLIIHEVCHWIITTHDRRNKPEFGLGVGFNTMDSNSAEKNRDKTVNNRSEELATCFLAACW